MNRGIYLIPNLLTLSSMLCGFYSVILALNGDYSKAALIIIAAGVFDMLDGRVARMTNSSSQFGMELDSLSDIFSFGFAPAFLIYLHSLQPFGRFGWIAAFFFVACGALRLARFNSAAKMAASKSFIGLPIPAAAGVIISYVIFVNSEFAVYAPVIQEHPVTAAIMIYILSFLMVSNFRYHGFKELEARERGNFKLLIALLFVLFTAAAYYKFTLIIIGVIYVFSGPVEYLIVRTKRRFRHAGQTLKGAVSHQE